MRINNKKLKNRKKLLLDFVSNKEYQPMRAKDIAMLLQIPKGKRSELFQVLDELEAEGKIICKKGKYEKVRKIATVKTGSPELSEGTFIAHPKGFGFVELEDQEEDLYIPQGTGESERRTNRSAPGRNDCTDSWTWNHGSSWYI